MLLLLSVAKVLSLGHSIGEIVGKPAVFTFHVVPRRALTPRLYHLPRKPLWIGQSCLGALARGFCQPHQGDTRPILASHAYLGTC